MVELICKVSRGAKYDSDVKIKNGVSNRAAKLEFYGKLTIAHV